MAETSGSSTGAPLPPPVPGWTPPPPSQNRLAMGALEHLAVTWGRVAGFLLLFIGTLVAVAFATQGGACFSPPTGCPNFAPGAANAILAAKILWTLGLFFIGASSGLQLMNGHKAPVGGSPDEYHWVRLERTFNFAMVILVIVLLWILMSFGPAA